MNGSVPLVELLGQLRAAGLSIGIDDHLRVGRLIASQAEWTDASLRCALRAALAKTPQEAELFDDVYVALYGAEATVRGAPVAGTQDVPHLPERGEGSGDGREPRRDSSHPAMRVRPTQGRRRWRAWKLATTFAVVIAAGGAGALYVVVSARPPAPASQRQRGAAAPRETSSRDASARDASVARAKAGAGDTRRQASARRPDVVDAGGRTLPEEPAAEATAPGGAPVPPRRATSDTASTRHPPWLGASLAGIAAAATVALLSALALARARRRAFVPGPWSWRLRAPARAVPRVVSDHEIEDVAAALTVVDPLEVGREIDVERTIVATCDRAGLPTLVYRPPPPSPRYVLLLDGASSTGSVHALFEPIGAALRRTGVHVETFEFEGEPDRCVPIGGGAPVSLHGLVDACDALVVVGDAASAWDGLRRRPAAWVKELREFPRRLWLNPTPRARWTKGARVVTDAATPMVHGGVAALAQLGRAPAQREEQDEAPELSPVALLYPDTQTGLASLRRHLGPAGLRWLAACAVVGEPATDVALWVAERLDLELTHDDRVRMLALPWFAMTRWPPGLRARLVAAVPEVAAEARRLRRALLDAEVPPEGSIAHLRWETAHLVAAAEAGDRVDRARRARVLRSPIAGEAQVALRGAGVRALPRTTWVAIGAAAVLAASAASGGVVAWDSRPDAAAVSAARARTGRARTAARTRGELRFERLLTLRHHGAVHDAAFSPDGRRIVTASEDGTARVWSASGGELAVLHGHTGPVWSATFSPDGTHIATASSDHTVRVWDLGGREVAVLRGHTAPVWVAAYSPTGTRILSAGDHSARLWDTRGQELAAFRGTSDNLVTAAAFGPRGRNVVTAYDDGSAFLWDISGRNLATLVGHSGSVWSVSFSPDGRRIVTAAFDATARIWDINGRQRVVLQGHGGSVRRARFAPSGATVVTASADGTARIWDAQTGQALTVLRGHDASVRSAAFSPDATRIVTASADHTAIVWAPPATPSPPAARCAEGMLLVPAATFWMGSREGVGDPDEHPRHEVSVGALCMDRTEVTVAQYDACVRTGRCTRAEPTAWFRESTLADRRAGSRACNAGREDRAEHPINCVSWEQARDYCAWRGGRLPTEAEWEHAARGADERRFPWGDEPPDATRVNGAGDEIRSAAWATSRQYVGDDGYPETAPAGSFPAGASPFGLLDMAGNVWEMTADNYAPYSLATVASDSATRTPPARPVSRGGGYYVGRWAGLRAADRNWDDLDERFPGLGFRCVADSTSEPGRDRQIETTRDGLREADAAASPDVGAATLDVGELPDSPSYRAIAAALRAVEPGVRACAPGMAGTAVVTLTISGPTGRVTGASVTGQFGGTPEGACIARAVRRARFRRFQQDSVSLTYRLGVAGGAGSIELEASRDREARRRDLDALLDRAVGADGGAGRGERGDAGVGTSGLPDTPTRGEIEAGMNSVAGEVRACSSGTHGTVTVRVTISGRTGRVTDAAVTGRLGGTPEGPRSPSFCIARALRGARFPRFSRSSLSVIFPFQI